MLTGKFYFLKICIVVCTDKDEDTGNFLGNILKFKVNFENCRPVFWRNDEQSVYGTGHASFTTSPDRNEPWIVYHAMERPDGGNFLKFRILRFRKETHQ